MLPKLRRGALSLLLALPLAASLVSLGVTPARSQSQGVRYVPGTGVGLVPPKGMAASKTFSGFEDRDAGASILVAEFPPEAYAQILTTFTPEGLAASGLQTSGAAADLRIAGGEGGRLVRGKQQAHGLVFRKWVLLAKGPGNTVMLSVQAPEGKTAELSDAAVEAALKTVSLKATPGIEEQAAALPYRIGDRAGFRLVRVVAGSGLMLTDGPRDIIPDASQPVVIVASALGSVSARDKAAREALAQQAFAGIAGVSDVSIVSQSIEERDGATWSRIEGRGTYRASAEAISTLQLMRFGDDGYIRIVAITRTVGGDAVLKRVDALAASVTPK